MYEKKITIIVGLFVAAASALVFVLVLLLGQEQSLFDETSILYISFEDVGGLKPGSQVRLAGVTIGIVENIAFGQSLADKKLHVQVKVEKRMMGRIRADSVATIATKGLLGDKVIQISIGSQDADPLIEGDYLKSEEPPDMFRILESADKLANRISDVAENVNSKLDIIFDEETNTNIKGIIKSLDQILVNIDTGDGLANALIKDKQLKKDLKYAVANIKRASKTVKISMDHIEGILREVKEGEGLIHGLVYKKEGDIIIKNLQTVTESLAKIMNEVEDGEGMLHTLVYESDRGNIIKNLEEASADLRILIAEIQKGRGTVGALLKDPTVYEDLKRLLGDLRRNSTLKALIRMSLESDEPDDAKNRIEPKTFDEDAAAPDQSIAPEANEAKSEAEEAGR